MGILEQFIEQPFKRTTTTFNKPSGLIASGSPKQSMGSSFILLNARAAGATPCRLRLYADETSRDIDANRVTGSFTLNDSVALIADVLLTSSVSINFDPPIIGSTYGGNVYWTINTFTSAVDTTVTVTSYPIEQNGGANEDRTSLIITGSAVTTQSYAARGTITSPKSFIILSGSATVPSRLRLYSRPIDNVPSSEISRSFDTETLDGSFLIADLMFDSTSFQYPLVPVLEGYTWDAKNYSVGSGEVGYVLENLTGTPSTISASLYLYTTEN